jgi:PAS domain-containing protein
VSVEHRGTPSALSAVEAGDVLDLPADVVRALADAGYLRSTLHQGVPRFAMVDLKAFLARTAGGEGGPWVFADDVDELAPDDLVQLLDGRVDDMALRTLHLLQTVLPEARHWSAEQTERFLTDARDRIAAILAVCAHGPGGGADDEAVARDLAEIGADAAHHGVPLPGMLVALRTSRDLMVQAAVEVAEERGRRWGLALAIALTRVIPAIDRLSDAVARGYWEAVLEIDAEGVDRFRALAGRVAEGVFALDGDGVVRFVNPTLATLLGVEADSVVGRHALEALGVDPGADGVVAGRPARQVERVRDGIVVGWDGVVATGE